MVVVIVKRMIILILLSSFFILASCSASKKTEPSDVLQTYLDLWKQHKFTEMYDMLTVTAQEHYATEDFIDRYEKIYHDLNIKDVNIDFTPFEYEKNQTSITVPIEVSMDSIAGSIDFTYDITLESYVNKDEKIDSWLIEWDPGLIFPQLVDDGKIKIETEEANRGEIFDRNEMPLAINDTAYEVGIVPELFEDKDAELKKIDPLLHMKVKDIKEIIEADWVQPEHFVPLKTIPKSDEDTLKKLKRIPSIVLQETNGRTYPYADVLVHLIGYIGKVNEEDLEEFSDGDYKEDDSIGKRGLERLYEETLRGETGINIIVETLDELGNPQHETLAEKPVKHGENVHLTIDISLQELLFERYDDDLKGTAAAVHPNTGEVLALVSSPSYDPITLTYGINQSDWDELMEDEDNPFLNRFTATFAPGSVIKPVTGAIGLQNNSITHEEGIEINGLRWSDYNVKRVSVSNGPVTLDDALIRSDNIYFAMKAVEMGNDEMVEGLEKFGFGEPLPLDYPFSASQISNSGDLENNTLRANTGYGQGEIEVNVLHMALLYTPILNEGNLTKPILLTNENKGEIWKENLLTEEDANKLKESLRKVVTEGTASSINNQGIAISGKTGTAELKMGTDVSGQENGWFVGYPTEEEDLIVAMLIEEAEHLGTSSYVAQQVAAVLNEYKNLK